MPALRVWGIGLRQGCLQQPKHLDDAWLIGATAGSAVARLEAWGSVVSNRRAARSRPRFPSTLNSPRELLTG
jgi:hypothetical protein